MAQLLTAAQLQCGTNYDVLWHAWTDTVHANPHTTTSPGLFVCHRHDMPDWAAAALEFCDDTGASHIFRARTIHMFRPVPPAYKKLMVKAEKRMNTMSSSGTSLKEEICVTAFNPSRNHFLEPQ